MPKSKKIGKYPSFMVILSLTIALFLIGLCGLISFQAKKLSTIVRQNLEIQVYLDAEISKSKIDSIQVLLNAMPFVAKNEAGKPNVTFVSKDQAAKQFIEETKENFSNFLEENPLQDAFLVKVKDEFFNDKYLVKVKASLSKINGINEISYIENLADDINKNISKIYLFLSAFVLLLLLTIIVLINNTIKLAVFSQRMLIRSMQLVGASNSFIQKPFILRGAAQGLVSAAIACVIVFTTYQAAITQIPELSKLSTYSDFSIIALTLFVLGISIGVVCTYSAIHRYLGLTLDELYK